MAITGAGTADGAVPTIPPIAQMADIPWNIGRHEIAPAEGTTPIPAATSDTRTTSPFRTLLN